jgi:hypothetical protein
MSASDEAAKQAGSVRGTARLRGAALLMLGEDEPFFDELANLLTAITAAVLPRGSLIAEAADRTADAYLSAGQHTQEST